MDKSSHIDEETHACLFVCARLRCCACWGTQDRILVFHRGIGVERLTGRLMAQKLDLLMDYTVFHILGMLTSPFKKKDPAVVRAQAREVARVEQAKRAASAAAMPNFHMYDSLPDGLKKAVDLVATRTPGASRTTSPQTLSPPGSVKGTYVSQNWRASTALCHNRLHIRVLLHSDLCGRSL